MVILVIEKAWKSKLRHFTLEAWITVNVWSQVHGESWWQRPYQNLLSYEHVSRNSVSVCHIMVRDCSDGVCLTLHHLCLHSQIQMSIYWSRIPVPKAEGIEESPNSCIIYSKLECKLETKVARLHGPEHEVPSFSRPSAGAAGETSAKAVPSPAFRQAMNEGSFSKHMQTPSTAFVRKPTPELETVSPETRSSESGNLFVGVRKPRNHHLTITTMRTRASRITDSDRWKKKGEEGGEGGG